MNAPDLIIFGIDGGLADYIRRETERGRLPHFARLLKEGCLLRNLLPPHPTITPVCWSSLQTGASPQVHGVVAEVLHDTSRPLKEIYSSYRGETSGRNGSGRQRRGRAKRR